MMNSSLALYPHHPYGTYLFESPTTATTNDANRFYSMQPTTATPPDEAFDDEDQIPTADEFRAIIDDYLNNLSPKKRDKALVDRYRYCLIQQVLRDPRNTAISTAQFRFWVKKMFQLQPGTTDLVCHDNKPVAMKEQIYDILVKAHREAHHGGRDKTSALVRRRFSWIPKELVARFVRHCPFCITRRNSGHSPSTLVSKNSSPRSSRYSRHGCYFESVNGIHSICTPSSLKEDGSDLSSGPPSSDSGYDATPNYVTMSSSPSPRRPYFSSMYERHENDFLERHYESSLQGSFHNNMNHYGGFTRHNNHHEAAVAARHPLAHHSQQQQQHHQPHSPLFYNQNYSGYTFYSTGYYPNALGITPCQQQQQQQESTSTSTSSSATSSNSASAAAVAVAAANSTAAVAAAAVAAAALMRSQSPPTNSTSDLLSHIKQEQHYSMSSTAANSNHNNGNHHHYMPNNVAYHQPLTMPENAYGTDL